jgi:predicted dinucleotide-binding enzyme
MSNSETCDRRRRQLLLTSSGLALAAAMRPWRAIAQGTGGTTLRIGVIGSGHIGGTVGGLWVKAGHPVLFSSRHPEELKNLVAGLGPLARAGTVDEAIAFGDVLFVAIPYGALPQLGKDYAAALKGKIVLDAGNTSAARDGGAIADEVEREGIGGTSQKYLPGTHLVRAFNTMSYMILAREANRPDPRLAIPIAGDDPEAVQVAAGALLQGLGRTETSLTPCGCRASCSRSGGSAAGTDTCTRSPSRSSWDRLDRRARSDRRQPHTLRVAFLGQRTRGRPAIPFCFQESSASPWFLTEPTWSTGSPETRR